jgi:Tol biopolymer transport system component/DNA-binding winged helix-turn-helix (wHTH) protein
MGNKPARVLHSAVVGTNNGAGKISSLRRFGVFEVDLRVAELRRNGLKVKLQEQPFQVLALLLENPGEIITREDLRNRLWPVDTFVDFDHSLNAAIKRLRDALGDSAENPTFVETVARRGYRFLAPVSWIPSNGNGAGIVEAAPVSVAARRHPWWIAGIISAFVLVLLGGVLGFFLAPHAALPPRTTRLTANPLDDPVRAASISRDGHYLAFSDGNGFYLRQIDTGETHPLVLPEGMLATSISWFPDNSHLLVNLTAVYGNSSLWEISVLGGSARKLIDDGSFAAVSPDGKSVAYVAGKILRQRIRVASLVEEKAQDVAGEDGELFGTIAWSPDGRKIAYTTAKFVYGQETKGFLQVVDLRTKTSNQGPTSLLSLYGLNAAMTWSGDGRLIYSVAEARPRQSDANLWSVRFNRQMKLEGQPERLTNDQGVVYSVSSSGDGRRIVYLKGVPEPDVYVARLEPSDTLDEPQRLTLDDHQDIPYDWTTDSKSIVFVSDRTGSFNIYKQRLDQAVPDLLVDGSQHSQLVRLSPDGTQVFYLSYPLAGDPDSNVRLMGVPLAGGPPQQILKANWISNHQCARAPATLCLYSVIRDNDLTMFSFDPTRGQGSQILQIKGDTPQLFNWTLSPDGSTLAVAKAKWDAESKIRFVSIKDGSERSVAVRGWTGIESIDWDANSKGIWATTSDEKENALLHVDLQGNARTVWRPKNKIVGWAIPSRDGKRLALNIRSVSANAWMLERP